MRKIILAFGLIITPLTGVLAAEFTVSIAKDKPRIATVEAQLTPRDGRLSLARDGRDTGLYHGWATFVHEIEAFDAAGSALTPEYIPGGYWHLADHDGSPVEVRYTMLLQHDRFPNDPGEDELAWARDWGVMWTGRALFLEGADDGQITVEFDLPAGWKVSTPWQRSRSGQLVFAVPNYDVLLDSAFVAGTHEEIVIGEADAPQAILALGGEAPLAASGLITDLVNQALSRFTDLFETPPPGHLLLIAADATYWGGGVMGNTISMVFGGPLDEATTPMVAYITTHEMFHLWNANFNLAGSQAADALQWFSEGTAEYYTWRNFVRTGLVDSDAFLTELGDRYGQYLSALGAEGGDLSMSTAGAFKLDHYDLIYSGGMMAVAALDLKIRSATGGEKSMDDALRLIQARFSANSDQDMRAAELPELIKESTGAAVAQIFRRYITGHEVLPMDRFLGLAGLSLSRDSKGEAYHVTAKSAPSDSEVTVWAGIVGAQ